MKISLKVNILRIKIIIINGSLEMNLFPKTVDKIEVVKDFIYLGAKIFNTGSCENEIWRRIAMGKTVVIKLTCI